MTAGKPTRASKELNNQVQLTRLRLAQTQTAVETAQTEFRLAKRRRKEAKLAARRAKKLLKQAKADLAETQRAMAKAEARLAGHGQKKPAERRRKAKVPAPNNQAEQQSKPARPGTAAPGASSHMLVKPQSPEKSEGIETPPSEDTTNPDTSA